MAPEGMPSGFPRLHTGNPPETYWVVNPKTNEIEQLVTVMPDGLPVGWATCVVCNNFASRCICPSGIIGSRANEWIYINALARIEGENITPPVATDSMTVTMRALHWYKPKQKASGGFTLPPARKPAQPTSAPSPAPARTLSRKPAPTFEGAATDKAASDMAKNLTRTVTRSLKKSEPKTAPKRTLKRK